MSTYKETSEVLHEAGEEECESVNDSVDSLSEMGYVEVKVHFWIDVLGIF